MQFATFTPNDKKRLLDPGIGHIQMCLDQQAADKAQYARVQLARAEWFAAWPKACRCCEGTGGHGSHGGYMDPPEWDACEGTPDRPCFAQGYCPRCGKRAWDFETRDADEPCLGCGWMAERADFPPPAEMADYGCECGHLLFEALDSAHPQTAEEWAAWEQRLPRIW